MAQCGQYVHNVANVWFRVANVANVQLHVSNTKLSVVDSLNL